MVFLLVSLSIHQYEYNLHKDSVIYGRPEPYRVPLAERKGLIKTYYGYLPSWVSTTAYANFRYHLLTHIAYFSVDIDPYTGATGDIPNPTNLTTLLDYAHPRGVRVHMTYTIFGGTSVSTFLNNPTARSTAIDSIVQMISDYGLDGANIDFEYVYSSVRDSFNVFINDLYQALLNHPDGRKELYIAMPPIPSWYPGYDYAYLSDNSDGLFLMEYDYHYAGDDDAGPVAPTVNSDFWGYYAVNTSIGDCIDYGADREKLILGMPYYGYDWPTESDLMGSLTRGTGSAVVFKNAVVNAATYGRLWDSYSLTPWYEYYVSGDGWHQCWYDDSVSIGLKLDIVNDSCLQGGGCWALGYDDGYDDLWNIIQTKLWIEPPDRHYVVEVVASGLNIRKGPSTAYPVMTYAVQGEKFVAFDREGNWYKVYFPSASGQYYGWMYGGDGTNVQYLEGSTEDTIVRITASLLNVREGPSTTYSVITQFAYGQVFVVDSVSGGWSEVYLPVLSGYTRGWCYTASYARTIVSPEDSNLYDATVDTVVCPDTVFSGDTFTVSVKVINTGYGPFDENVFVSSGNVSPFYDTLSWLDESTSTTSGFDGLPGQIFTRSFVCLARGVSDTVEVEDTLYFKRRNTVFGDQVIVKTVVIPSGLHVEQDTTPQITEKPYFNINRNIFTGEVSVSGISSGGYTLLIIDRTGRVVEEYKGKGRFLHRIGRNLTSGVYFYIYMDEKMVRTGKLLKIR